MSATPFFWNDRPECPRCYAMVDEEGDCPTCSPEARARRMARLRDGIARAGMAGMVIERASRFADRLVPPLDLPGYRFEYGGLMLFDMLRLRSDHTVRWQRVYRKALARLGKAADRIAAREREAA